MNDLEKLYEKHDALVDSIQKLTVQMALSNQSHEAMQKTVSELGQYKDYLKTLKWWIDNIKSGFGKVVGIVVVVSVIYAVGTSSKQYVMDTLKVEQVKEVTKNG